MKISLRPLQLIFEWMDNKERKKLRIADYLDDISNEVEIIAELWEEIVNTLLAKEKVGSKGMEKWGLLFGPEKGYQIMNRKPYSRIRSHYEKISTVLGKNEKELMESLMYKIGNVLMKRDLTLSIVEKEVINIHYHIFENQDKRQLLLKSVNDLYTESAEIQVIAKCFRASI